MDISVLLVDDEKDFAESLADRLILKSFNVKTAFSGAEALNLIKDNDFDVIILDVLMPGKSGIETLKEIKMLKHIPQVIMLTGHATIEAAIQGMKIGAYDYLMKPTENDVLIEKITSAYKLVAEQKERIRKAEINKIVGTKGW